MISVIIPTRDRPALLVQCLNGLFCQQADPKTFEVLIGDDHSSYDVAGLVAVHPLSARVAIRTVRASVRGAAAARNVAAEAARGEILALLDDDAVPDARWITTIERTLGRARQDGVVAITGRIAPLQSGILSDARQARYDARRESVLRAKDTMVGYLAGGNSAIFADEFKRLGGFDVRCTMMHDRELVLRLRAAGHQCAYEDDLLIYHVHVKETFEAVTNAFRSGRFRRVLEAIHPTEQRPIQNDFATVWKLLHDGNTKAGRLLSVINALLHGVHVVGYLSAPDAEPAAALGN